jgi:prepilin-type N-terminal cleavage/methylation domain-containing protein
MLKQLKRQSGFTIIELLIVIAIIGILATLVLTNFQGAQAKGRDTVRTSDMNSIYQKLEEFYNQNGGYPDGALSGTVAAGVNEAAVADGEKVFPGIDEGALLDEEGAEITVTTTTGNAPDSVAIPTTTVEYAYIGYNCDTAVAAGSATTAGINATCDEYTIATFLERDVLGYTKLSLN